MDILRRQLDDWMGRTINGHGRESCRTDGPSYLSAGMTLRGRSLTLLLGPLLMKGIHEEFALQWTQESVMQSTCLNTPTTIPSLDQIQLIAPFSFPQPTTSPPTQNGFKALGRFNPSIFFSSPSASWTPFSRRATSNRGIAAAVPFRVCANGSGASDSVDGRYRT